MKVGKTVAFELSHIEKINQMVTKRKSDFPTVMNYILNEFFKREQEKDDYDAITILQCQKCGAKYSNKFDNCPGCVTKEAENDIKNIDNTRRALENKDKVKLLTAQKEPLIDEIRKMNYTIGRLVAEDRQEDAFKLELGTVAQKRAELKRINDEILAAGNEEVRETLGEK